ncbi:MAG: F0F1 ATP synthase subunit delta [Chloroflexota bacterium]
MQIDWFTFVVQIINFIILLVLLRLFLYKPVIRVMDERERLISQRLHAAEEARQTAENEANAVREEKQRLQREREALQAQARQEVEKERKAALERVRREAEEMRLRWQRTVAQEKENFLRDLRRRTSALVFTVVRQTLAEMADAELEDRMVRRFIEHLRQLDDDERHAMIAELQRAHNAVVTSAFPLPDDAQQRLNQTIAETLLPEVNVTFMTDPELVAGIELRAHGRVLQWSLGSYLAEVEQTVAEMLENAR